MTRVLAAPRSWTTAVPLVALVGVVDLAKVESKSIEDALAAFVFLAINP